MRRLLIPVMILLLIAGCGSGAPERPRTDPCLALHTLGHPDCRPPTSVPVPTPTTPTPTVETIRLPGKVWVVFLCLSVTISDGGSCG
jgi:hypothetical protein